MWCGKTLHTKTKYSPQDKTVVWENAAHPVFSPRLGAAWKKQHYNIFSPSLPQDGPSRSALYLLSSNLPPSSVEPIVRGTFQTLTSLQQLSSKTYDHTPLLVALVSWQQTGDVIKVVNQWLSSFLSEVQTNGMSLVEPPNAGKGKVRVHY